jgi:hypothetical protein
MSINAAIASPLALREGFHVVLLKALAERLQGRDWVLKGGTNLRLYFSSIRFSEDIDLDVGKDVAGAMQRAIPAALADGDVQRRLRALGILQASLLGGRSNKSTDTTTVRTPFGTYQFHRLDPALIGGYGPYRNTGNFDIATPAKALFDALYLSTRRGRRLRHFPELSWPADFSRRELREWIAKIDDDNLRVAVTERWEALRRKSQS